MHTLSLSSASWRFRDTATRSWSPATVPGCVHTDLFRSGRIPDPFFGINELALQWVEERDWEYRTRFSVPLECLQAEVIEMVADGLDTLAEVFLNGHRIGRTDNMFIRHRWRITPQLRPGANELRIVFRSAADHLRRTRRGFNPPREFSDPVGGSVRLRKQPCQFGWDWGPRFVTAGIWRDLRLEAWTDNQLRDVRISQQHAHDGSVTLQLSPELARPGRAVRLEGAVSIDGQNVASITDGRCAIPDPRLWWPAGQGAQPLYTVAVLARDPAGREVGRLTRRIGLRTLRLERRPDRWGESFRFVINDRPVFFKGANWIPAHSFVAGLRRPDYARDLRAAAAANMNGVRVWGGGVYESEDFYDLCDELGLLVWQDFMFACTLYPTNPAFLASVKREAEQQVARLRHRACLALWCGNNEIVQLNLDHLRRRPALRRGYERLFHRLLPSVVAARDGVTGYWPSSEWRGTFAAGHARGEKRGDTHFWDVWHARKPAKEYERWKFRFCSEFGMQSYSSPATNATFCPAEDGNVFGPALENHQKNPAGNQIILDYVSRRYRLPGSQADLIYLSQLNQAHCLKTAVEHFRRQMPRCMGTIYWQLNDCWPAASWSSIEFTGRWKALHHAAARFYAPALVCAHGPDDEIVTVGNYRRSAVGKVHLYTVYDAPAAASGLLRWEVRRFDGPLLLAGRQVVRLRSGQSMKQKSLDLRVLATRHGPDNIYLRLTLESGGAVVSENTVFLAPPRFLSLPRPVTRVTVHGCGPRRVRLAFRSPVFQHALAFDLAGLAYRGTDNFFDLYPDENREIEIELPRALPLERLRKKLSWRSLADTYA